MDWLIRFRGTNQRRPAEPADLVELAVAAEWRKRSLELLRVEYESIRNESSQARQAQQSIIQWSLATLGVGLSAGILVINTLGSNTLGVEQRKPLYVVFLVLFGLAFPAAAWLSCLAWFGELIRMERAGRYLRGLERVVSDAIAETYPDCDETSYLCSPLRWETYIATRRPRGLGASKQRVGYLGNLGIYTGLLVVPLGIFVTQVWMNAILWNFPLVREIFTAYAVVLLISFIAITVTLVRALQQASSQTADVDDVVPRRQKAEVPGRT
jgi:hypothetical protein